LFCACWWLSPLECIDNAVLCWLVAVITLQVPILGVAVNKVPARDLAITTSQLKQR
jgi:hypothetical protein